MAAMATALDKLTNQPSHFGDCCPGVSKPLVETLLDRLPQHPALILSIGSGSGLLEALLLQASAHHHKQAVNLFGVEVPTCINSHLAEERLLRVPSTLSLHPDAFLASALMFVYPRDASLIGKYLEALLEGALDQIIWFGHRHDWPPVKDLLVATFDNVELVCGPGIADYEMVANATMPKVSTENA